MHCIYNGDDFRLDRHNLKKIKAPASNRQKWNMRLPAARSWFTSRDADGEARWVYYGETAKLRLLAVVVTERQGRIRVITAYELDAGQKRDYMERHVLRS